MQPWNNIPQWKDEKAFLNWLRSSTRRIWARHIIRIEYKKKRRYKAPIGRYGKDVWVSDCEICGKQSRNTEVDHIKAGGSFYDWDSYTQWAKRILWVTFDDIRELCKDCHSIVTYSQKHNISFEEAKRQKEIIKKCKQSVAKQKDELLKLGFKESEISNQEKRKKCYEIMDDK